MNRLAAAFEQRRIGGRKSLLPFITAGYPDLATTLEILANVDAGPCACVELGIPYSDPIADGPVIQLSYARALSAGFRVGEFFSALGSARRAIAVPLLAMVSYSIVFRHGVGGFIDAARDAGIEGVIVPDLAIEEADELARVASSCGCCLAMMAAPTTEPSRRARIAALSSPFIYYQSVTGVTGERVELPRELAANVSALREASGKPACVGFGISTPAQVASVCAIADGAIVGSALVRRMHAAVDAGAGRRGAADAALRTINELAAGLPG